MTDTTDIDSLPLRPPLSPPRGSLRLSRPRPQQRPPAPARRLRRNQDACASNPSSPASPTLRPNDAIEAGLAADLIIAAEQSRDAVRWVHIYRANGEHKLAARTQAHGSLLPARGSANACARSTASRPPRRKRHADPEATDTAERIEHITMVTTAEAVEQDARPHTAALRAAKARHRRGSRLKTNVSKTSPQSLQTKTENPAETARTAAHTKAPPAAPCSTRPNRPSRTGSQPPLSRRVGRHAPAAPAQQADPKPATPPPCERATHFEGLLFAAHD